jgi:hypothetical protein
MIVDWEPLSFSIIKFFSIGTIGAIVYLVGNHELAADHRFVGVNLTQGAALAETFPGRAAQGGCPGTCRPFYETNRAY